MAAIGANVAVARQFKRMHAFVKPIQHRTLHLWPLLGDIVSVSVAELATILSHRVSFVFMALTVVVLATANPFNVQQTIPVWQLAIIWPSAVAVYLMFTISVLAGFAVIAPFFGHFRLPAPLVSALGLVPSVFVMGPMAELITGGVYRFDLSGQILIIFLLIQVFEAVFYRFVLPQNPVFRALAVRPHDTKQRSRPNMKVQPATTTTKDRSRHIMIGAQRVPVSRVRHIEAREHHVKVTLDGASIMHRARLGDIVAQTNPEDGCQPHRSWWVSKQAARTLEKDGARHVLRLDDNTRVPVARTRLPAVQTWVARHVPDARDQ